MSWPGCINKLGSQRTLLYSLYFALEGSAKVSLMNIGWIFIICALLILILLAMRPWQQNERIKPAQEGSAPFRLLNASPDTESQLPIVQTPDDDGRFSRLTGNKMMAIRLYREQTGAGLQEAKEAVDRLERVLRQEWNRPGS